MVLLHGRGVACQAAELAYSCRHNASTNRSTVCCRQTRYSNHGWEEEEEAGRVVVPGREEVEKVAEKALWCDVGLL